MFSPPALFPAGSVRGCHQPACSDLGRLFSHVAVRAPRGGHRRGAFVAPTAAAGAAATSTSAGESAAASATLRGGRRIAQSAAAPLTMIGSFFGSSGSSGGGGSDGVGSMMARMNNIEVLIERPTMNSRKISASCIVEKPLADVWSILTDYDNLATHVPNLVESRVLPGYGSPLGESSLFQAQAANAPTGAAQLPTLPGGRAEDHRLRLQRLGGHGHARDSEAPGSRLPKRAISNRAVAVLQRVRRPVDGRSTRGEVPGTDDEYVYKTKLFKVGSSVF